MRTLQLLPLVAALGAVACGEGDAGEPIPDSFDDPRPLIYSEQPEAPSEKSRQSSETAQPEPEAQPQPSPFGVDSERSLESSSSDASPGSADPID